MARLSKTELARFQLEYDDLDNTLNLYHLPCRELVKCSPAVDDLSLRHWDDAAQEHVCLLGAE